MRAISSRAALPARSPRPFMVACASCAPAPRAAMVFATARPKSLWQCTPIGTLMLLISLVKKSKLLSGVRMPTVSQGVTRSTPTSTAVWKTWTR